MSAPYFSPELVSQTIYINLGRSPDRKLRMEMMAEEIGLENMVRVEGVDGASLSDKVRSDALLRTKVPRHFNGKAWEETGYVDQLLPEQVEIPQEIQKIALGRYGCQAGHIKAFQYAIKNLKPEDEDKWVVILEDDALLKREDADAINNALRDAPQDAGAIMLAGVQFLESGAVPIDAGKKELAIPMQANCTIGIAYRPAMLRVMAKLYEKNLSMSREKGGISPVDNVNWVVQQELLGLPAYKNKAEYKHLAGIFKNESEDLEQNKFYILNPGLVYASGEETTIGTPESESNLRAGMKLNLFGEEEAKEIYTMMSEIKDPKIRARASDIILKACESPEINAGDAVERIRAMTSVAKRFSPRISDPAQQK